MNYRRRMMLFDVLVAINHWSVSAVLALMIVAKLIWPHAIWWSVPVIAVILRVLACCALLGWFFDEYTALRDDE